MREEDSGLGCERERERQGEKGADVSECCLGIGMLTRGWQHEGRLGPALTSFGCYLISVVGTREWILVKKYIYIVKYLFYPSGLGFSTVLPVLPVKY